MGLAAVFTAINTMLSALAARTKEIGILLSIGYRPFAIFVSFLFEAILLGLIGGLIGCVLAFQVNGVETGTSNINTFTEVAFAFRLTPMVFGHRSLLCGLTGPDRRDMACGESCAPNADRSAAPVGLRGRRTGDILGLKGSWGFGTFAHARRRIWEALCLAPHFDGLRARIRRAEVLANESPKLASLSSLRAVYLAALWSC